MSKQIIKKMKTNSKRKKPKLILKIDTPVKNEVVTIDKEINTSGNVTSNKLDTLKKDALDTLKKDALVTLKKDALVTLKKDALVTLSRFYLYYVRNWGLGLFKSYNTLKKIRDISHLMYCKLGPGYTEGVYQEALAIELRERGFKVACEITTPIVYGPHQLSSHADRTDMIINDYIVLELKIDKTSLSQALIQLRRYFVSNPIRKIGAVISFNSKKFLKRKYPPTKKDRYLNLHFAPYCYRY